MTVSVERILIALCALGFAVNTAKAQTAGKTESLLTNKSPGRAPARGLKMKSSKVPSFEIHKAGKTIPRLDIGEEAVLGFEAPRSPASSVGAPTLKPIQKAASPAVVTFENRKDGV